MEKIVAIGADESFDFIYGGIKWFLRPLPYGVKKTIIANSSRAQNKMEITVDLADLAIMAVKYGVVGWSGFAFANGEEAVCKKEKDKNGIECLSQETVELLYRTPIFDVLSACCTKNDLIPKFMEDAVEWTEQQKISPPEIEADKKK